MKYYARKNQTLSTHLINVACLAKAFGKAFGVANIAFLAGLLHDLGKYTTEFQTYLEKSIKGEKVTRGDVIHAFQGAKFILETFKDPVLAEIIANPIAAHHNGLYDGITDGEKTLLIKTEDDGLHYSEAKEAFLSENGNRLPHDLVNLCEQEIAYICRLSNEKELNGWFMLHLFTKIIYSCLVDADRYDSAGFNINDEINRKTPAWEEYFFRLKRHIQNNQADACEAINTARKIISEQCERAGERGQGMYTLAVPTGAGKTLSSLRFALSHAKKYQCDRIIYIIPYLSILDQTAKSIRKALAEDDFEDAYRRTDDFIFEHHSNIEIPETDDDEEEYKLLSSRWGSPIILTTMVQFLETIYSNKASRLRKFHNMANSVIIFDEIQALPIKCVHLFNDAVNFLNVFGNAAILFCTATQPHLNKVDRPVRMSENPNIVSLPNTDSFKRTFVTRETFLEYDLDELSKFVKKQLDSGKSTLVVLNTKTTAEKLYDKCGELDCDKALLTTNLCPAHRLKILERLRDSLQNKRLALCVSTQLIEAGVDVSFPRAVRAKAGLDSVVQTAGRCNRNGENPIPQKVFVVDLKEENLSKLPEIRAGKDAAGRVFRDTSIKDFLSEEALNLYYQYYFYDQKKKMDYAISNPKTTIYNLLSKNNLALAAYNDQNETAHEGLPCAFRTAAENFSVIENGQTGIVVPYGEADTLVKQFEHTYDPKERVRILGKLQKYTISVYAYALEKLVEAKVVSLVDNQFYYLDTRYYKCKDGDDRGLVLGEKLSLLYI
jgi:CRISPR-associated endonuclease/helicase Cas3